MGEIVLVSLGLVKPTQLYLNANSLALVLEDYLKGDGIFLPPPPVFQFGEEYLAIDGHHRLSIDLFLGYKTVAVYNCTNTKDLINKAAFPELMHDAIDHSNRTISHRSRRIFYERDYVKKRGVVEMNELFGYREMLPKIASEKVLLNLQDYLTSAIS